MPWLRIDDGFAEHPKVMDLTDRAFRLHVAALGYCAKNLTDGFVSDQHLRVISAIVTTARTTKQVFELAASGLWIPEGDGYRIKDYLQYNPAAAEVKEDRRLARERKRKSRAQSRVTPPVTDGVTPPGSHGGSHGPPSRPVPTRKKIESKEGWEGWDLTAEQVAKVLAVPAGDRRRLLELAERAENRVGYFLRCVDTELSKQPKAETPEQRMERLLAWLGNAGWQMPKADREDELRRMGATDHDIQQIVREAA